MDQNSTVISSFNVSGPISITKSLLNSYSLFANEKKRNFFLLSKTAASQGIKVEPLKQLTKSSLIDFFVDFLEFEYHPAEKQKMKHALST